MTGFRVGQTVECVNDGGGDDYLVEGGRYTVRKVGEGGAVVLTVDPTCWWGSYRFRAVEPSLIDPDLWSHLRRYAATFATGSWSAEVLTLWCLTVMAPTWLGALVGALPSRSVRTWDDYPEWSVWRRVDGWVWVVDHISDWPEERGGTLAHARRIHDGKPEFFTLDQMSDWVCVSMPKVVAR